MKYALNLAEDGRILSATYPQFAPIGAILVDELPEGNICDYLCIIHEIELPTDVVDPENTTDSEITESGEESVEVEESTERTEDDVTEEPEEEPEEPEEQPSYYVEYVYDPLPIEEVVPEPTTDEVLNALLGVNRYE